MSAVGDFFKNLFGFGGGGGEAKATPEQQAGMAKLKADNDKIRADIKAGRFDGPEGPSGLQAGINYQPPPVRGPGR